VLHSMHITQMTNDQQKHRLTTVPEAHSFKAVSQGAQR